jgi:hypothetical protein
MSRPLPIAPFSVSKLNTLAQILFAALLLGSRAFGFEPGLGIAIGSGLVAMLTLASMAAYLAAAPPMMFGEGFFCGAAMALIVVYRPAWCATFDDARYLPPGPSG